MPTKLEIQIPRMMHDNVVLSFTDYVCINEQGMTLQSVCAPARLGFRGMLLSNFMGCLTVVYDSEYFGKIWQPEIKKRNDYAQSLTMLWRFPEAVAVGIPECLGEYRVNSYGLSSNKFDAIRYFWQCLREYGNVSVSSTFARLPIYLSLVFMKKTSPQLYNFIIGSRNFL